MAAGIIMIQVYDTQRQKKVAFEPTVPGQVRMYVCGPTVYNLFHIGNARPFVAFDVVARHLRSRGLKVTYVRNITDVDDKIINRAREGGEDPAALAERFTQEFHRDVDALGCQRPDVEPRATAHIAEMIAQIEALVSRGLAYEVEGDVYYAVSRFPGYGELSHLPMEDLLAGARKEVDPRKRDAADFALWKAAKPGEPSWPSPWGAGRPGWHIECSAMSEKYLGPTFDLHGGGVDLRFPHHENERAQAQGVNGPGTFARHWLHNGFVGFRWVHGGEVIAEGSKIAKSDERMRAMYQVFVARSCIERHGGEAARLFLLTTHYRNPITFDVDLAPDADPRVVPARTPGLEEAEQRMEYAYLTMQRLGDALVVGTEAGPGAVHKEAEGWLERLQAALDDDFNTPLALAEWSGALALCNRVLDDKNRDKDKDALPKDVRRRTLQRLFSDLRQAGASLGLLEAEPAAWLEAHRRRRAARRGLDVAEIEGRIRERDEARRGKDFARSDALRADLLARGVELMDTPTGTRWRIAD